MPAGGKSTIWGLSREALGPLGELIGSGAGSVLSGSSEQLRHHCDAPSDANEHKHTTALMGGPPHRPSAVAHNWGSLAHLSRWCSLRVSEWTEWTHTGGGKARAFKATPNATRWRHNSSLTSPLPSLQVAALKSHGSGRPTPVGRSPIAEFLAGALEPPDFRVVNAAISQLQMLGALEPTEALTPLGQVR
jgi:hypothetical protein